MTQTQTPSRDSTTSGPQWWPFVRNVLLVAVVLTMAWVAFNVELPSAEQLQSDIEDLGWVGWVVFVVSVALVALTPIPLTIMAITAGLLFDTVIGTALAVVGVVIGCMGAYGLARLLGSELVTRLLGSWSARIERHLDSAGYLAIVTLRLMPGVPFWPVNYGAGAFEVPVRVYFLATVVATIPGQVSLVAIGSFVAEPSFLRGLVVVVAWAVILVMTVLSLRRWRASTSDDTPEGAEQPA